MTSAQATTDAPGGESRRAMAGLGVALLLMSVGPSILRSAESSGLSFASWRMIGGAVGYLLFLWLRGGRVGWDALRAAAPGGVFFGTEIALGYAAIANTSIANAIVILALRPAAVMVFVGPIFGERVRLRTVAWTAVAIGGVGVAVFGAGEGGQSSLDGDLLAVLAMLISSGYLIVSKSTRVRYDAMTYSTAMMIVAALVLFPVATMAKGGIEPPPAGDWVWIAGMVLLPGAGHVLTNYAHEHVKLTVVASVFLVLPGMSTFVAWLLVDEVIAPAHIIGMIITLGALAMVVLRDQ